MTNMYTSGEYLANHPSWHVENSPWKAKQILKIINNNNLSPKSICEVGCGAGEILNQLYPKFSDDTYFVGYDISPQAFLLCKPKTQERLSFYCKNIIEDTDVFFDLILCIDVLEHIESYLTFLRHLKMKAKYKIFHIPLDLSVQTVLRNSPLLNVRKNIGHIHYFSKDLALSALKEQDYQIIDYYYTASRIELPNTNKKLTPIAKLPRKLMYALNKDIAVRILGGYSLMVLVS